MLALARETICLYIMVGVTAKPSHCMLACRFSVLQCINKMRWLCSTQRTKNIKLEGIITELSASFGQRHPPTNKLMGVIKLTVRDNQNCNVHSGV